MCLDNRSTQPELDKWLEGQPRTITAYKVVRKGTRERIAHVYPVYFTGGHGPFKKVNITQQETMIVVNRNRYRYEPNYHLFANKVDAMLWKSLHCTYALGIVLKCKVPKTHITAIGEQDNKIVIIASKFTFVEGEEYFGKKKEAKCV